MPSQHRPLISRLWFQKGDTLDTPGDRARAMVHFHLVDHAYLRGLWHNEDEIAPGAWRSNQPSPRRFDRFARRGIKTVLNLRGENKNPHYLIEAEACARLGLTLINYPMAARAALEPARYLGLLDIFDTIEKPFVMHCKSGADRAGLASALYLIHVEGVAPRKARAMLSRRYVHLKQTKTGILDHLLDCYIKAHDETGIALRDWFETVYDRETIRDGFTPRWSV